jgi:DNA-binding MarR family transcriptional regulator
MPLIDSPSVGLAFLLSQVGAHAAAGFGQRLSAIDLTPQHVGIIRMLASNAGMTQQHIASLFGIFPSRLVALLDELESRKLVARRSNQADRRSYHLHLTAAGKRSLQRIEIITKELEEDLFSSLNPVERETLTALLHRIVSQQKITPAVHPAYRDREARLRADTTKPKEKNPS